MPIIFNVCAFEKGSARLGSAPIYAFARHVVSTILHSNELSGGYEKQLIAYIYELEKGQTRQ